MNFEGAVIQGDFRNTATRSAGRFRKVNLWTALLASLMASLVLPAFASAQRLDGTLRVTVADSTGAGIADAKVMVTNEATNVSIMTTASSAATYVFPNLLVGSYTVTVEKPGFKKAVNREIGRAHV